MRKFNSYTIEYGTTKQLKLPLDLEKIIDISDPVYTFSEVLDHIDLRNFFAAEECKMGRPRCDQEKMLKVILFASKMTVLFLINGSVTVKKYQIGYCIGGIIVLSLTKAL